MCISIILNLKKSLSRLYSSPTSEPCFNHKDLTFKFLYNYSQFMLIKKNMFDRLEEDWKVMLKDMYEETAAHRNRVVIPVLEEQGVGHD